MNGAKAIAGAVAAGVIALAAPAEVPEQVDPAGFDLPDGRHRIIIYAGTDTIAPADGPPHPVAQAIRWLRIAAGTE